MYILVSLLKNEKKNLNPFLLMVILTNKLDFGLRKHSHFMSNLSKMIMKLHKKLLNDVIMIHFHCLFRFMRMMRICLMYAAIILHYLRIKTWNISIYTFKPPIYTCNVLICICNTYRGYIF